METAIYVKSQHWDILIVFGVRLTKQENDGF